MKFRDFTYGVKQNFEMNVLSFVWLLLKLEFEPTIQCQTDGCYLISLQYGVKKFLEI